MWYNIYRSIVCTHFRFINLQRVEVIRRASTTHIMKVLNVAEKNDAAKNIAGFLSHGTSRRRDGLSVYNKIYEFNIRLWNQDCLMVMTSVSGHLLGYEFVEGYRKWQGCHPLTLFDAPVVKQCSGDYIKIKQTLEREVKTCGALIIWTDCDREGENIGFEIIQVCQAIKPNIRIYRAKFSEITQTSINRAIQTLGQPNKAISDAVDVRSELDLRIGAAFTRFQTLRLQKVFPRSLADMLISYGSCQFPTLGFVVERFLAIDRFKPEPYWKIKVTDVRGNLSVEFRWDRVRLFEQLPCQVILDMCLEAPNAIVQKVIQKPKSKWRPLPLDTIELEKQGSRKLHLNAKETMKIAEKLYTQGLISYPRTETNIFPKELNLTTLVTQQTESPLWGQFAGRVLTDGITPRQGKKSDAAHPPIHPTKYTNSLQGNEAKVYEFVVRHFLACLSKNAEGQETIVNIDIAGEKFTASGLHITARNYLEVYIYDKWSDKEIHEYRERETFRPTAIDMVQEETSPPSLLTEADLIALMDKHGIGTDATHAEHIDTIKSRQYVGLVDGKHFMPGKLGIGLVMGYDNMGFEMSKPNLRADLEKDLKLICDGQKNPKDVLQCQITKYRDVFKIAMTQANLIDTALATYLEERPQETAQMEMTNIVEYKPVFKCPKCGSHMVLRNRKQGVGKFMSCTAFPTCNNAIWFPETVEDVTVLDNTCDRCGNGWQKLQFKLRRGAFPIFGTSYITCIGGCDPDFNETFSIRRSNIRRSENDNDSGYVTASGSSQSANSRNTNQSNNTTSRARGGSSTSTQQRPAHRTQRGNKENDIFKGPGVLPQKNNKTVTARQDSTNLNSTFGNAESNSVIMCNCHETANQLTVRKEGPNQGRLFYVCAKPQESRCSFFLWASNNPNTNQDTSTSRDLPVNNNTNSNWANNNPSRRNTNTNNSRVDWGNTSAASDSVMCTCNQPARLLTVHKEGPNKGRQFYGCPQGMNSGCNFFQWADDNDRSTSHANGGNWTTQNRGRRGGSNRGEGSGASAPKKPRVTGNKRKCGICGVEGHTRKTCPENVMD